jgi:hypothetical protein
MGIKKAEFHAVFKAIIEVAKRLVLIFFLALFVNTHKTTVKMIVRLCFEKGVLEQFFAGQG